MAKILSLVGSPPGTERRSREDIGRSKKVARKVEEKQWNLYAIVARRIGRQTLLRDCLGEGVGLVEWLVQGERVR